MFVWIADKNERVEIFGINKPPYEVNQERKLNLNSSEVSGVLREAVLNLHPE